MLSSTDPLSLFGILPIGRSLTPLYIRPSLTLLYNFHFCVVNLSLFPFIMPSFISLLCVFLVLCPTQPPFLLLTVSINILFSFTISSCYKLCLSRSSSPFFSIVIRQFCTSYFPIVHVSHPFDDILQKKHFTSLFINLRFILLLSQLFFLLNASLPWLFLS